MKIRAALLELSHADRTHKVNLTDIFLQLLVALAPIKDAVVHANL